MVNLLSNNAYNAAKKQTDKKLSSLKQALKIVAKENKPEKTLKEKK